MIIKWSTNLNGYDYKMEHEFKWSTSLNGYDYKMEHEFKRP